MTNNQEIIRDYGLTVTPEIYNEGISAHQYIGQSDAAIFRIISKFAEARGRNLTVYDLGCGPGRITFTMGNLDAVDSVVGVDLSDSFINYAKKQGKNNNKVQFQIADLGKENLNKRMTASSADVIVLQGVLHHVHGKERENFFNWIQFLLKEDSIIIVGDEFLKNYKTESERIENACCFYAHIIAEALKGGANILAREEAKNMIDDTLHGQEGAGFADENLLEEIYTKSQQINDLFYSGEQQKILEIAKELLKKIRETSTNISRVKDIESFNRGDLKVSINVFRKEMEMRGFTTSHVFKFGPVDELGGMAILIINKKGF
jgi:2-polyprenyl-3-methyl-5-hydroxy-6-metoxy-1,4-benzoquinol methylase